MVYGFVILMVISFLEFENGRVYCNNAPTKMCTHFGGGVVTQNRF